MGHASFNMVVNTLLLGTATNTQETGFDFQKSEYLLFLLEDQLDSKARLWKGSGAFAPAPERSLSCRDGHFCCANYLAKCCVQFTITIKVHHPAKHQASTEATTAQNPKAQG